MIDALQTLVAVIGWALLIGSWVALICFFAAFVLDHRQEDR